MWAVYSGEVRGEVGTRSGMWGGVGTWGFCYYMLCLGNMVRSAVSCYVCRNYLFILPRHSIYSIFSNVIHTRI